MRDDRSNDAVLRLLGLVAERLESFLDGDETALETLAESIEQVGFSADELQSAILVLRSLGGTLAGPGAPSLEGVPARDAQRVPSAEERESLSPEAWGFLLDLKRRGSLDHEQFERVLDLVTGCGVRPVGVDLVREVAARVALKVERGPSRGESHYGDIDLVH
jgi:uncharacterized protein Smg (DUF494 family)